MLKKIIYLIWLYIGRIKGKYKNVFFNLLDVFVLPSIQLKNDQDGIPVVLMEAIANSIVLLRKIQIKMKQFSKNSFKFSEKYDVVINSKEKIRLIEWKFKDIFLIFKDIYEMGKKRIGLVKVQKMILMHC